MAEQAAFLSQQEMRAGRSLQGREKNVKISR